MHSDTEFILSKQYTNSKVGIWIHSERQKECWVHERWDGQTKIHECETSLKWLSRVAGNDIQETDLYRAVNYLRLGYKKKPIC